VFLVFLLRVSPPANSPPFAYPCRIVNLVVIPVVPPFFFPFTTLAVLQRLICPPAPSVLAQPPFHLPPRFCWVCFIPSFPASCIHYQRSLPRNSHVILVLFSNFLEHLVAVPFDFLVSDSLSLLPELFMVSGRDIRWFFSLFLA